MEEEKVPVSSLPLVFTLLRQPGTSQPVGHLPAAFPSPLQELTHTLHQTFLEEELCSSDLCIPYEMLLQSHSNSLQQEHSCKNQSVHLYTSVEFQEL